MNNDNKNMLKDLAKSEINIKIKEFQTEIDKIQLYMSDKDRVDIFSKCSLILDEIAKKTESLKVISDTPKF
jgi:hypothetical protein